MNISEVYMLSDNIWEFYFGRAYTLFFFPTGNHMWDLRKGEIMESSFSYTPQDLFDWVFE